MMRRKLLTSLLIFASLILIALATLYYTPLGLRCILTVSNHVLSGKINIGKLQGSLSRTITLSKVNYVSDLKHITIRQARLKIQPLSLTRLSIQLLSAKQLQVAIADSVAIRADTLTGKLKFNPNAIVFNAQLSKAGSTLNLNGQYSRQLPHSWHMDITSQAFNPHVFHQLYHGHINLHISAQGTCQQHCVSTIKLMKFQGQYNQQQLNARGQFSMHNTQIDRINLRLHLAKNTINISGRGQPSLGIHWQLHLRDLHQFMPKLAGTIDSYGNLTGTQANPVVNTLVTANNLRYATNTAQRIRAHLHVNFIKHTISHLAIQAKQLHLGKLLVKTINIHVSNKNQQQVFNSFIRFNKTTITGRFFGHHDSQQNAWRGQIDKLTIHDRFKQVWRLQQADAITATTTAIKVPKFCLAHTDKQICFESHWHFKQAASIKATAKKFPLDDLREFYPEHLLTTPNVDIDFALEKPYQQAWQGSLMAKIHQGELIYPIFSQLETIHVKQASIIAQLRPHKTQANLNLQLNHGEQLTAFLRLPNYQATHLPSSNEAISGNANINLTHLHVLSLLLPQLHDVKGKLSSHMTIAGSFKKPRLSGNFQLNHLQAYLPRFGTRIKNGSIQLNTDHQQAFTLKANLQAASGTLAITGHGMLALNNIQSQLQITGDNFLIADMPQAKVAVSPNLAIKTKGNAMTITGKVVIPSAMITPSDYKKNKVIAAEDIVYTKHGKPVYSKSTYRLTSTIKVRLGKKVFLNYLGVNTRMVGQLQVNTLPNRPTNATGSLRSVAGNYDAYGQKLTIKHGELVFNGGPITNPGIDVQATRTIKVVSNTPNFQLNSAALNSESVFLSQTPNLTLGVNVQNTLRNPVITLFSDPSGLSQTDILSYLLIGRPAAQASAADGQTLVSAAAALQVNGINVQSFTDKVQKALGLSELSIESEQNIDKNENMIENTSLVLGKYLTPRLYVDYSIGLLEPINTFRVRLTLTKNWVAQATTNVFGNGGDLFYSIERG